jgi:hypothetical protein
MSKCSPFTEIPLIEKTQTATDEADTPHTLRDRCDTLRNWIRYWWTWVGAMCC